MTHCPLALKYKFTMNLKSTLLLLLCLMMAGMVAAKDNTKVIAHRGYWKTEGSAQNSIRSLERASEIGAYGSEFDVHLTADNVLVVYHDNDIQGKHIQSCTYDELKDLQLSNGEKLPTLEQYLKRAKKLKNIRLIFELKSHDTPERNRDAARLSVQMVKRMKLAKRTDYISFNMDACKEFIRLCPKSEVSYLNGELSPMELKELGFTGLDYHYKVLQSHPDWVKDCKVLGMTSNVWTVDDPKLMEEMIDMARKAAGEMGLYPYYLYRQKNIAGNFENVGYAKVDKAGIYNILIMEEKQSIVAAGAGASTKVVLPYEIPAPGSKNGRMTNLIRIENVRDVGEYISRIDEMIERKGEWLWH